ncbi:hypothetical protein PC117_g15524 [Phytophthora cactorum]|uniref:Uncharacterized protein n=1 Tax=Phytophthora cactorum TaxID=29920 RepID=A0A8T1CLN7_9STRA|nr:hypothetical protein PC117_g15524 [Phytophthora cactorum]
MVSILNDQFLTSSRLAWFKNVLLSPVHAGGLVRCRQGQRAVHLRVDQMVYALEKPLGRVHGRLDSETGLELPGKAVTLCRCAHQLPNFSLA